MRTRFCILALFFLSLFTAGAATQRTYLVGAIGGQYRVQMDLTVTGSRATGTYYYESVGAPLILRGKVYKGAVTLEELNDAGKIAAKLTGTLSPGRLTGAWKSADGKRFLPVNLTAVASYRYRNAKKGRASVSVAYPRFLRKTPTLQRLNQRIETIVNSAQQRFFYQAARAHDPRGTPGWTLDFYYAISYYADDLQSLLVTDEEYTGGAHGNTGYRGEQYVVSKKKLVRVFGLAEVFKPTPDYSKALSKLVVAELRRQQAGWIMDNSVTAFNSSDLSIFTFTPKTLVFVFPPYAVGPYAQGSFTVAIPFRALENYLNHKGALGRFFTSLGQSA